MVLGGDCVSCCFTVYCCPIVCVGYVLSWAVIVLLFNSLLHAPIVCMLCIVLGCDCVVVDSLFIAAPVCVEIIICPGW